MDIPKHLTVSALTAEFRHAHTVHVGVPHVDTDGTCVILCELQRGGTVRAVKPTP